MKEICFEIVLILFYVLFLVSLCREVKQLWIVFGNFVRWTVLGIGDLLGWIVSGIIDLFTQRRLRWVAVSVVFVTITLIGSLYLYVKYPSIFDSSKTAQSVADEYANKKAEAKVEDALEAKITRYREEYNKYKFKAEQALHKMTSAKSPSERERYFEESQYYSRQMEILDDKCRRETGHSIF